MPVFAPPVLRVLPFSQWGLGLDAQPLMIAGPCSAESAEQVMTTARAMAATGRVHVMRAGVWKPRTRPGSYEGAGSEALGWLKDAGQATGLLTMTEVANAEHVEACLEAGIDMLWIGARTTPNPFSVQEIADALRGVDIPVFVKNPINPDLQLWMGALERLNRAGIQRLAAIHRGFSWFERTPYRNSPMWEFPIRLMASIPDLEMVCDPSHISGSPEGLGAIAQQALDLNMHGLMVETHCDPPNALSDADQQIDPEALELLLESLIARRSRPGEELNDRLQKLRDQIDQLDEELAMKLGARMDLAERIGDHKRTHNVAIVQPERWESIMRRQLRIGEQLGLSKAFIEEFMNAVHKESIQRQTAAWERADVAMNASGTPASVHNGMDPTNGSA